MSPFDAWENFYIIVGSSAGALTGLQFVVMALVSENRRMTKSAGEVNAFGTPTVVHFCAVLLLGAVVSAPWPRVSEAALVLTLCGIAGVVYTGIVIRRARRQTGYKPVFEDWLWHALLPGVAYIGLAVGGVMVTAYPEPALFTTGAAALVLLFDGIHNAWDTVVYVMIGVSAGGSEEPPAARR